jgi:hypothetical protein
MKNNVNLINSRNREKGFSYENGIKKFPPIAYSLSWGFLCNSDYNKLHFEYKCSRSMRSFAPLRMTMPKVPQNDYTK